jgi:two-component system response regulator HydG
MSEKPSVLIVDDDPSMSRTTSLILTHMGYRVTTARSGAEAIERTRETEFDMTILDIMMPERSGVETLREVKQMRPEATVVMMTAYASDKSVKEALAEGAHGIIYKPFEVDAVVSLINQATETIGGLQILLVDDDPSTRRSLGNVLKAKGYDVGEAVSGQEAVELAGSAGYDVIFLDLRLPDMNGLEAYLQIRALDPRVVVFLITAYRDQSDGLVEEAITRTVRGCLDKPFDMSEVLQSLRQVRADFLGP